MPYWGKWICQKHMKVVVLKLLFSFTFTRIIYHFWGFILPLRLGLERIMPINSSQQPLKLISPLAWTIIKNFFICNKQAHLCLFTYYYQSFRVILTLLTTNIAYSVGNYMEKPSQFPPQNQQGLAAEEARLVGWQSSTYGICWAFTKNFRWHQITMWCLTQKWSTDQIWLMPWGNLCLCNLYQNKHALHQYFQFSFKFKVKELKNYFYSSIQ